VDNIETGEIKSEKGDVAFTFRRVLDPDDPDNTYSEVDIKDDGLRELLKEIIGTDYPGQNFDGDTVNITAPFPSLVSPDSISYHQAIRKKAHQSPRFLEGIPTVSSHCMADNSHRFTTGQT